MSKIKLHHSTSNDHLGPQMSRRKFLRLCATSAAVVALPGAASVIYSTEIEPNALQSTEHVVSIAKLPAAFDGLRVAQLTDIHFDDSYMDEPRLHDIVEKTLDLRPDVVALTGDFVTSVANRHADALVRGLSRLGAALPTVAVLGNHDYWTDAGTIRAVLRRSNIEEIGNRVYTLNRNGQLLHIAGLDDIWEQQQRLDAVLDALPDEAPALMLCHEPDFADTVAATGRFALQMSGHSHGGQVVIPGMKPPVLPWLGEKYHTGAYLVGDMVQYTARGLGMVAPQVRFNCRPELALHILRASS